MAEIKTVTFALVHFSVAFSVAYLITGSATLGGLLALVEPLCNTAAFYIHEQIWLRFQHPVVTNAPVRNSDDAALA